MANQWYHGRAGKQSGPIDEVALRSMIASGQVLPSDLAWTEGMSGWSPVGSLPQFASQPMAAPPPIPNSLNYQGPLPPPPRNPDDIGQNAGIRMLLPVGRSGWAIAAGYLGLFSVL